MTEETKTMESIISDAQKEGIDYSQKEESSQPSPESTAKPDAPKESSSKPVDKPAQMPPVGEKTVEEHFQESKLPAHLFPQFKDLYAKNRIYEKQLKEKDELLKDPRIARLLAQGQENTEEVKQEPAAKPQTNGQITDEQKVALEQLSSMLGIDKYAEVIKTLQRQNEELTKREEEKAFDSEESDLRKLSSEHGLDYDNEVYPELTAWLQKNKQFQGLGPGSLKFAFNNIYFSKMGELAERKKNLEMIQEQEKKKSGQVETPSKVGKPAVKTFKNDDDMIASVIKDAGGLDNIDFHS